MQEPALWSVALNAFAAVIVLLGVLALAIRALGAVFPPPPPSPAPERPAPGAAPDATLDAPTLAAVQAAVQRALPGARVVRVEETPGGPR